jgi:anti-sigma factor RsiW
VDDGTLHAYLDGELSPTEAQGVEAHLAQCPGCQGRLEEERAVITRAGELLAVAAPPDRELPPFRAGDPKPPARAWWRVRQPLAWAATIVLALGIGNYLGRGVKQVGKSETAADAEPVHPGALEAPLSSERARRESRVAVRGGAPKPPAPQPAVPAPATPNRADDVAQQRDAPVTAHAEGATYPVPAPAPQPSFVSLNGERYVLKGSPISLDTARALLGSDPLAVPSAPIRAIYGAREIGYSAVVIVEQALDSSTVIEVVNRRRSQLALDEVVVTAAPAAQPDSVSVPKRARLGGAPVADSLAAPPAAKVAARSQRRLDNLEIHISGPLPSDSLRKLLQLVQPVKP